MPGAPRAPGARPVVLSALWLLVAVLAVWRLTHLLVAEDGPGDLVARLRAAFTGPIWRSLWSCFHCMSLWVALPVAAGFTASWGERVLIWLGLSGAACLLERGVPSAPTPAVFFEGEAEEAEHGVLRRRTAGRDAPET